MKKVIADYIPGKSPIKKKDQMLQVFTCLPLIPAFNRIFTEQRAQIWSLHNNVMGKIYCVFSPLRKIINYYREIQKLLSNKKEILTHSMLTGKIIIIKNASSSLRRC